VPRGEKKRRLSYKESKELEALPERIDEMERERARLYESLADPELLRDGAAVVEAKSRLAVLDAEISASMERWEELATMEAGGEE
jgi:ATP-binding cassette subfamily F protein uup